jgi:hypothetical protein
LRLLRRIKTSHVAAPEEIIADLQTLPEARKEVRQDADLFTMHSAMHLETNSRFLADKGRGFFLPAND